MLINRQNLSVIIVSFKSDYIIQKCINSIDKEIEIIVVDNSNNTEFKKLIEDKYTNVRCILSSKNIGMGAGNNIGIRNTNKDFALILNPDVVLEKDAINQIINASKINVDYNIQETGALWRLDSNNIHDFPKLQICTNINKQHL